VGTLSVLVETPKKLVETLSVLVGTPKNTGGNTKRAGGKTQKHWWENPKNPGWNTLKTLVGVCNFHQPP